jgi:hypothetical protein
MFGWILVIIGVLAIFNAEKLPALKQMMEDKFKDSMEAAKVGSKIAKNKIKQVKADIDSKKNAEPQEKEREENTPEEIEESLQFMGSFIKKDEAETKAEDKETPQKDTEKVIELPQEPTESENDGKVDLENRY